MDKSYNIFKIKTLLLFIILIYVSLNLIFLSEEYSEDRQLIVIEVTLLFLLIVKWILNKWLTNIGTLPCPCGHYTVRPNVTTVFATIISI